MRTMIRLDIEQRSPEWIAARIGLPTASQFHRILTPKTMKPSGQQDAYLNELLAEWALDCSLQGDVSEFMERGTGLEESAVQFYEFTQEEKSEKVGFCLLDDGSAGCSPDRLVGAGGGLEIKCPSPQVHIANMLDQGDLDKYRAQVQGCLWITEREWWDTLSYHPSLPPAVVRAERDERFIALLAELVSEFCERLTAGRERLREMGVHSRRAA
jgi:hypothetical protein